MPGYIRLAAGRLISGVNVRRAVIQIMLPFVFCAVPLCSAVLIAGALPGDARNFYLLHMTPLDKLILILGGILFVIQTLFALRAMRWIGISFDERFDTWLVNLNQAAEWFPLLGLIGTVASIMQTFATFGSPGTVVSQQEIIAKYAPAITATISGLFMALINILPTWVVLVGRDIILSLSGESNPNRETGRNMDGSSRDSRPGTRTSHSTDSKSR